MNTKKWTCKDGRKIRIKDMDTDHLRNTVNMLRRSHQHGILQMERFANFLQGEYAIMAAESEMDEALNHESYHPLYDDLMGELERRGAPTVRPEHGG